MIITSSYETTQRSDAYYRQYKLAILNYGRTRNKEALNNQIAYLRSVYTERHVTRYCSAHPATEARYIRLELEEYDRRRNACCTLHKQRNSLKEETCM